MRLNASSLKKLRLARRSHSGYDNGLGKEAWAGCQSHPNAGWNRSDRDARAEFCGNIVGVWRHSNSRLALRPDGTMWAPLATSRGLPCHFLTNVGDRWHFDINGFPSWHEVLAAFRHHIGRDDSASNLRLRPFPPAGDNLKNHHGVTEDTERQRRSGCIFCPLCDLRFSVVNSGAAVRC